MRKVINNKLLEAVAQEFNERLEDQDGLEEIVTDFHFRKMTRKELINNVLNDIDTFEQNGKVDANHKIQRDKVFYNIAQVMDGFWL